MTQRLSPPRLSIVVITKNRKHLLERCVASVIREIEADYPLAELIVIDGGSTDGTREYLEGLGPRLDTWVSEPDSGLAQAVNKGLARSRGDIVRVVGDDDEFMPGKLRIMMEIVDNMPAYDVVAGHNQVIFESPEGEQRYGAQARFLGEISRREMCRWGRPRVLVPEACFFRRAALERVRGYDESIKWWGFLDLFFRMMDSGSRFFVLPVPMLKTYQTERSETLSNEGNARFWREQLDIFHRHAGPYWRLWHQFGGTMRPDKIALLYIRKVCARVGFHPRKIMRAMSGDRESLNRGSQ